MKNKRSVLVLFTSALAVVVACGGSNSSEVFGGGTGDGGGGAGTDAMSGSDGTVADGATEGGGGNDGGGTDGGTKDAAIDAEKKDAAVDPATLCTSTGGTVSTSLCCKSAGDFPDTCKVGACGCAPTSSHTVQSCLCPLNDCFDAVVGCRAR